MKPMKKVGKAGEKDTAPLRQPSAATSPIGEGSNCYEKARTNETELRYDTELGCYRWTVRK